MFRETKAVIQYVNEASENNPLVTQYDEQSLLAARSIPETLHTTTEEIDMALVARCFGIILVSSMQAARNVDLFHSRFSTGYQARFDYDFRVDREFALDTGIITFLRALPRYDPERSALAAYMGKSIRGAVYRSQPYTGVTLPIAMAEFIYGRYPEAMKIAEQAEPQQYSGTRDQRASAVLNALCGLVTGSLLPATGKNHKNLRLAFDTLRQSSSSWEARIGRINTHATAPDHEDDMAPIYYRVRNGLPDQHNLEPLSSLDPQDRTQRLLDDLDPADPTWQTLLKDLIGETGIELSEVQRQTLFSMYTLNDLGEFTSQAEIAESRGVSKQRVSRVVAEILNKARKQQL